MSDLPNRKRNASRGGGGGEVRLDAARCCGAEITTQKKNSSKHDTASGLIALINEIEEDTEGVFDRLMLRASW